MLYLSTSPSEKAFVWRWKGRFEIQNNLFQARSFLNQMHHDLSRCWNISSLSMF